MRRDVTVGSGATFRIASTPDLDGFWDRVESGKWEPETLSAIDQIVSPGDKVIDVGAWIGVTALYAASLGGNVIAYEPDPEAVAAMQANLALNAGLPISLNAVALSTKPGIASLRSRSLGDSMSSLVRTAGDLTASAAVECRAIASEAAEHFSGVRLVKVDVEGYEFELLPPMMRALRDRRFQGDLLLSTHAYPTVEKSMERLARSGAKSLRSYRLIRVGFTYFVLPLLMLRRNLRLLWSLRGCSSAQISQRSSGVWRKFSVLRRIWFVAHPGNQELWLRWRG